MDILNNHFKIQENSWQLAKLNKKALDLKGENQKLKNHLTNESNILSASLCYLLHINVYDFTVGHLLNMDGENNQSAIQIWVLEKLVKVGYPYESYPIRKLKDKLEVDLNRSILS